MELKAKVFSFGFYGKEISELSEDELNLIKNSKWAEIVDPQQIEQLRSNFHTNSLEDKKDLEVIPKNFIVRMNSIAWRNFYFGNSFIVAKKEYFLLIDYLLEHLNSADKSSKDLTENELRSNENRLKSNENVLKSNRDDNSFVDIALIRSKLNIDPKTAHYICKKLNEKNLLDLEKKNNTTYVRLNKIEENEVVKEESYFVDEINIDAKKIKLLRYIPVYQQIKNLIRTSENGVDSKTIHEFFGMSSKIALKLMQKLATEENKEFIITTEINHKSTIFKIFKKSILEKKKKEKQERISSGKAAELSESISTKDRQDALKFLAKKYEIFFLEKNILREMSELTGWKYSFDRKSLLNDAKLAGLSVIKIDTANILFKYIICIPEINKDDPKIKTLIENNINMKYTKLQNKIRNLIVFSPLFTFIDDGFPLNLWRSYKTFYNIISNTSYYNDSAIGDNTSYYNDSTIRDNTSYYNDQLDNSNIEVNSIDIKNNLSCYNDKLDKSSVNSIDNTLRFTADIIKNIKVKEFYEINKIYASNIKLAISLEIFNRFPNKFSHLNIPINPIRSIYSSKLENIKISEDVKKISNELDNYKVSEYVDMIGNRYKSTFVPKLNPLSYLHILEALKENGFLSYTINSNNTIQIDLNHDNKELNDNKDFTSILNVKMENLIGITKEQTYIPYEEREALFRKIYNFNEEELYEQSKTIIEDLYEGRLKMLLINKLSIFASAIKSNDKKKNTTDKKSFILNERNTNLYLKVKKGLVTDGLLTIEIFSGYSDLEIASVLNYMSDKLIITGFTSASRVLNVKIHPKFWLYCNENIDFCYKYSYITDYYYRIFFYRVYKTIKNNGSADIDLLLEKVKFAEKFELLTFFDIYQDTFKVTNFDGFLIETIKEVSNPFLL